MPQYGYRPLDERKQEIRLVTLHPASSFDRPVSISISHVAFDAPQDSTSDIFAPQPSSHDVETALPIGWWAHQTIEGRFIFENGVGTVPTRHTYEHPNPGFQHQDLLASWHPPKQQDRNPAFEALSYCWGTSKVVEHVIVVSAVDPMLSTTTIGISESLCTCLRYLRSATAERVLWIDAICINQADVVERSKQVLRMTQIYQHATRVIAWLGSEADESAQAIDLLRWIASQCAMCAFTYLAAPGAQNIEVYDTTYKISASDEAWRAMLMLFSRPYFHRRWVVQEIALAKHWLIAQCGHKKLTFLELYTAISVLYGKNYEPVPGLKEKMNNVRGLFGHDDSAPLSILLLTHLSRKCNDARDAIYGLLGLTSPAIQAAVNINYGQSATKCHRDAFLGICKTYQRLDLLRFCCLDPSDNSRPSWVPDFVSVRNLVTNCQHASGPSLASFAASGDELHVVGVKCCSITKAFRLPEEHRVTALRNWYATRRAQTIPTDASQQALAQVLINGRTRDKALRGSVLLPSIAELRAVIEDPDLDLRTFSLPAYGIERCTMNSSIFESEDGHIGIGPDIAEPGDIVACVLGSNSTILLRPQPSSNKFRVIGACYVHGFEDGQALLGPLPPSWKLQYDLIGGYRVVVELKRYPPLAGDKSVRLPDPRLPDMSSKWEWLPKRWSRDDPELGERYRNKEIGEIIQFHPSMTPEALRARGVPLQTFVLV